MNRRTRTGHHIAEWLQTARQLRGGPERRSERHSGILAGRHPRQSTRQTSRTSSARGALIPGIVALVVAVLMVAVGLTLAHRPAGATAAGAGAAAPAASGLAQQVTCGGPGQAACAGSGNVWIPLASNNPVDILVAVRKSTLFTEQHADAGDHVHDLSRLGAPLLVHALQPAGGSTGTVVWPDFYVIPILDAHGNTTDAAEAQLNPSHTAIHVIAIVTYTTPRSGGAIAALPASAAVGAVQAHAHTTLRAGAQPQLIYFPADAAAQQAGVVVWRGGGEFPADPIWFVPGADGQEHFVGDDGAVYAVGQLPMIRA